MIKSRVELELGCPGCRRHRRVADGVGATTSAPNSLHQPRGMTDGRALSGDPFAGRYTVAMFVGSAAIAPGVFRPYRLVRLSCDESDREAPTEVPTLLVGVSPNRRINTPSSLSVRRNGRTELPNT